MLETPKRGLNMLQQMIWPYSRGIASVGIVPYQVKVVFVVSCRRKLIMTSFGSFAWQLAGFCASPGIYNHSSQEFRRQFKLPSAIILDLY